MKLCLTIEEIKQDIKTIRQHNQTIALVPTMGNLHDGHLSLIETAKKQAASVVVSLFVNPLQFGPGEDFESYPRTVESDCQKLKALAVDAVFLPTRLTLYTHPETEQSVIDLPHLTQILCGKTRANHFQGVLVIVAKLFNIIQPDVAVFGEKDFQQLTLIKTMVENLNFPIRIISSPTIREKDGLAMSSRNSYLSVEERLNAPKLYNMLCQLKQQVHLVDHPYADLEAQAMQDLNAQGFKTEYVAIRNQADLSVPKDMPGALIILVAALLGKTRLIDNIFC